MKPNIRNSKKPRGTSPLKRIWKFFKDYRHYRKCRYGIFKSWELARVTL